MTGFADFANAKVSYKSYGKNDANKSGALNINLGANAKKVSLKVSD